MSHVNFYFTKDFSTSKKGDAKRLYKPLAIILQKRGVGDFKEAEPVIADKELKPVRSRKHGKSNR